MPSGLKAKSLFAAWSRVGMEKISTLVPVDPAEATSAVQDGERWQLIGHIGDISHIGGKALHLVKLLFGYPSMQAGDHANARAFLGRFGSTKIAAHFADSCSALLSTESYLRGHKEMAVCSV